MDSYIDQHETQGYGHFAIAQIEHLVQPLDAKLKGALAHVSALLAEATTNVQIAVDKAGAVDVATYAGSQETIDAARKSLRRAVKYAESREEGDAIAADILNGENLTTVLRRRPAKLANALTHAIGAIQKHAGGLPEAKARAAELTKLKTALDDLNTSVRKTRTDRRSLTPAVAAAREEWLKRYGAAKLLVECVLRLHDKTQLMSEVFDDLAEVHRVAGVTDGGAPAPAPAQPG